ncbi:MAG: topoisomerase C-terminal repeat-containing protein [Clostridia bacterium]|nr:topoisomerase C-terminal repeat-containing protein [Clostridia bacterium]
MSKTLIIAEKPSLAQKIVGAIGGMTRKQDYYEGQNYIVTSVFGHLLTLYDIEDYTGENKKSWSMEDIPFFPEKFKYKIKNDSGIKKRYKLIKDLINRQDVGCIINSGDADREGEVLINLVIYKIFSELKIQKQVKRIWLEDQTENTIRKELKYARDIKNTENLYKEGLARSYIDWLYGINLTRYISLKAGTTLNTGRVIIPTVKYIYDRDMEIKNFKPETYYTLPGEIEKEGQKIKIDFTDFKWKKEQLEAARNIENNFKNANIKVISVDNKTTIKKPKKLFSLASLQNYMSKKYKISLNKTLSIVQSLYEKGYLTYPRTNTEYMAEEEIPKVENIIKVINNSDIELKVTKAIFDSSKVESHSAITITEKIPDVSKLIDEEAKLYNVVKNRFMANFCKEECKLNQTTITFEIQNVSNEYKNQAKLKGTSILQLGYLKYENDLSEKAIPNFTEGEMLNCNFKLEEKQTTPPSKVTEAELNKFFEKPFKKQEIDNDEENADDDEDYKAILKGIEIGTPATRSGTVEKVKKIGYIKAEKNVLSITPLGERFIEILNQLNINLYKEKTVELSQNLKKIYNNEILIKDLLKTEEQQIKEIVNKNIEIERVESNSKKSNKKSKTKLGLCPICHNIVVENKAGYGCCGYKDGCKFFIGKNIAGRDISKSEAKQLLDNGETGLLQGFVSRAGKNFNAKLVLDNERKIKFEFKYK